VETVYQMIPGGIRPFYLMLPFALVLGLATLFLGSTLYGSQRASFVLDDTGLSFRGDVYGSPLAWSELRVDSARIVDLSHELTLRPRSRRMGTALLGYTSGWFTLDDGEKALLYLTDRRRAVYLPTTKGFTILVSPIDPEGFLADLKKRSAAHRGS